MPLLGRLFTKKTKASLRSGIPFNDQTATPALESPTAASDSNHSSRTFSSYVSPDQSTPSCPNAKSLVGVLRENGSARSPSPASSSSSFSRLRLFGRKKSSPAVLDLTGIASDINSSKEYNTPQRPVNPLVSGTETDSSDLRRLRPPPSRSAIFAAYADPGSTLSTRSLPDDPNHNSDSSRSLPPSQKRSSLFAWSKSTSSLKSPDESCDSVADNSFNLKSFRHIRAPSPPIPDSPDGNGFDSTFIPSISRPRGSSVHSDTSQRISVAAFREAQARRSNNASPIPSPRDMSQMAALPPSTTRTPEVSHPSGPKLSRSSAALLQGRDQRLSSAIASTTDEDSSSGDDSDNDSVYKGGRNAVLPRKAKSDLGHGSTALRSQTSRRNNDIPPLPRVPKSHLGHSPLGPSSRPATHFETRDIAKRTEMSSRSQSSLGVYNDTVRKGANASGSSLRSALVHRPSASIASSSTTSARKVSPIQNHPKTSDKQQPRGRVPINPPPRDTDSDSDDDAPLAALIPPRRPGSAMSNRSNPRSTSGHSNITTRSVSHPKPLIDVKELIASKPTVVNSTPPSDAAFTQGPTLLSIAKMAQSTTHGTSKSASDDYIPLMRRTLPVKLSSPPSSLAHEIKESSSPTLPKPSSEQKPGSITSMSTAVPLQKGATFEEQQRDPISDRLTRVVKKSMTSPSSPVQSSSPQPSVVASIASAHNTASGVASPESMHTPRLYDASRIVLPRTPPPILRHSDYSPPDEDLAQLLGTAGIKFISRNGESPDESSESETSAEELDADKERIAPIPIKQRSPPPAFTVTSRPPLPKPQQNGSSWSKGQDAELVEKRLSTMQSYTTYPGGRQRSSSLLPSPSATSFPSSKPSDSESNSTMSTYLTSAATDVSSKSGSSNRQAGYPVVSGPQRTDRAAGVPPPLNIRQRSTTMVAAIPSPQKNNKPDRTFVFRENSPPSSTGDSSSCRVPRTPRDGSDLGTQEKMTSTLKKPDEPANPRRSAHVKRRSVSFEDDVERIDTKPTSKGHIRDVAGVVSEGGVGGRGKNHVREGARAGADDEGTVEEKEKEDKRKERRRKEAKAAIELGNVIHGPPPVLDDDNDVPVNQAMNASMTTYNTLMNMGSSMAMPMGFGSSPSGGWLPNMNQPMLSPAQFMVSQPADPNILAAHQRAMMFAKQAYQMAVGQQAMAAAAEEWERGSALGGFSGGGNIHGGSSGPSMMTSPFGMMPSMGMMQGMQGGSVAGWSTTASVYGGMGDGPRFGNYLNSGNAMASSSHSDIGGPAGGTRNAGTWGPTRSVYGESFGPPADAFSRRPTGQQLQPTWNGARESVQFPSALSAPNSLNTHRQSGPDSRSPPRSRTASQPALPSRHQIPRRAPPPSSWRQAGS